jgi:hypothetical protein
MTDETAERLRLAIEGVERSLDAIGEELRELKERLAGETGESTALMSDEDLAFVDSLTKAHDPEGSPEDP